MQQDIVCCKKRHYKKLQCLHKFFCITRYTLVYKWRKIGPEFWPTNRGIVMHSSILVFNTVKLNSGHLFVLVAAIESCESWQRWEGRLFLQHVLWISGQWILMEIWNAFLRVSVLVNPLELSWCRHLDRSNIMYSVSCVCSVIDNFWSNNTPSFGICHLFLME